MKLTPFAGCITDAPAEAVCTSTNPRLSLMMGTGGAVRVRGGFEVLRACEDILAGSGGATMLPGTAHLTTAGRLPYRGVIHCVASDNTHLTSAGLIRGCVRNALARADEAGFRSLAMPVFGTGHAHFKFDRALTAIAEALRETQTSVEEVVVVVYEPERLEIARKILNG